MRGTESGAPGGVAHAMFPALAPARVPAEGGIKRRPSAAASGCCTARLLASAHLLRSLPKSSQGRESHRSAFGEVFRGTTSGIEVVPLGCPRPFPLQPRARGQSSCQRMAIRRREGRRRLLSQRVLREGVDRLVRSSRSMRFATRADKAPDRRPPAIAFAIVGRPRWAS